MQSILDELNPQQRQAVETVEGPVLVVAGAGSGKTRVITTRIMYLFHLGVSPYQILAMTFTNKAAAEMKERAAAGLGPDVRDLTVTTFHTFCSRFLRREIEYLGRQRNFAIFDAQDQLTSLKRVIRELDLPEKNYPAAHFRNKISFLKNSGTLDAEPATEVEQQIFKGYHDELLAQNALDFDDLLINACRILEEFPECRARYQKRFRYLMVDEYQDTNKIQAKLIHLLLDEHQNLCVVGDEDQSIYAWRGADIRNILEFETQFPQAKIFKLEQNYRSSQHILDYANQVITLNKRRKPKKLWTSSGPGSPVVIQDEMNGFNEAEFITQTILDLSHQGSAYSDIAVLFRSNYLSRYLEEMFRRYRLPYQLIGGLKFYDRKEIKDLLAYMRIVVNPRDWTSFARAAGVPSRGIGAKSLDKLYRVFAGGAAIPEILDRAVAKKLISGRGFAGLTEFQKIYRQMAALEDQVKPREWLDRLIQALDYRKYLEKQDEASAEYRVGNVEELLAGMTELEAQGVSTLSQFMDFSSLVSDQDEFEDEVAKVSMMTVHAAKGLEFDNVFVMGLEDGVFPNQRAVVDNPDGLEEERRLFYVAVTRAKKRLFLTYARSRQVYGSTTSNEKSRFLRTPGPRADFADPFLTPQTGPKKPKKKWADVDSQLARMKSQLKEQRDVEVNFGSLETPVFRPGDKVRHPSFGNGKIASVLGQGERQTVKVYFPGKGTKTLVAKIAKLEKVP